MHGRLRQEVSTYICLELCILEETPLDLPDSQNHLHSHPKCKVQGSPDREKDRKNREVDLDALMVNKPFVCRCQGT